MSLMAQKMGSKQRFEVSKNVTQGKSGNSIGVVSMAATPQGKGNADKFFSKVGDMLDHGIDSVGNQSNYKAKALSSLYMQLGKKNVVRILTE